MRKLMELKKQQELLKSEITEERIKLNKSFVKKHRTIFWMFDIAVVILILFNFGALMLTDYLVSKDRYIDAAEQGVEVELIEANPVAAKIHNYKGAETKEQQQRSQSILFAWIKQSVLWALLVSVYVYFRRRVYMEEHLTILVFIISYYFIALGLDFFHDLAIFLAKILFGG